MLDPSMCTDYWYISDISNAWKSLPDLREERRFNPLMPEARFA
jgi:hypothetical protein